MSGGTLSSVGRASNTLREPDYLSAIRYWDNITENLLEIQKMIEVGVKHWGGGNGEAFGVSGEHIGKGLEAIESAKEKVWECVERTTKNDVVKKKKQQKAAKTRVGGTQRRISRLFAPVDNAILQQKHQIEEEIISTERTYVAQLETVVLHYLAPISSGRGQVGLSEAHLSTLFLNVEELLSLHESFYARLTSGAREAPLCSEFEAFCATLSAPYGVYVPAFDSAQLLLGRLREENAHFSASLDSIYGFLLESRVSRVDPELSALLVAPVQRIPRYLLLLQQLRKYTPVEERAAVSRAVDAVAELAREINAKTSHRGEDELAALLEVQARLKGEAPNLVDPARRLLREGDMRVDGAPMHCWLFNDLLLYARAPAAKGEPFAFEGFFALAPPMRVEVGEALMVLCLERQRFELRGDDADLWAREVAALLHAQPQRAAERKRQQEGFLLKRGQLVKNWKRRFFQLRGHTLFYFESSDPGSKLKGTLNLNGYELRDAVEQTRRALCLELHHRSRTLFIQPESEEERQRWISALGEVVPLQEGLMVLEGYPIEQQQQQQEQKGDADEDVDHDDDLLHHDDEEDDDDEKEKEKEIVQEEE